MNELKKKIDQFLGGVKNYLTAGVGLVLVSYLQSKGIDAVGAIDLVTQLVNDAVVQVGIGWAAVQTIIRMVKPHKWAQR